MVDEAQTVLMNPYQDAERDGLAARINALRAADEAFRKKVPEAMSSIRRISRSLKFSDAAIRYPEVASIASAIEEAGDQSLPKILKDNLSRLQSFLNNLHSESHSVLVVEDDPLIAQIVQQRLLVANLRVLMAQTLAQAEKILRESEISLVLLDLQLPDGDGRELLMKLRDRPSTAGIPVFVVSSKQGSQVQTECFALGADAYFDKSTDPVTLSTAVAAKLQRSVESVRRSTTDPLTGLPNRSAFAAAFARESMLAGRSKQALTVAMLDVDRFKAVNDLYGHPMGDQVLKRLAQVVTRSLRASDLLARWGGEEFAVFFPNTDLTKARVALNKALNAFRQERFVCEDGRAFQVTFSAGVAQISPRTGIDQAISEADRLLYVAKASGRDRVLTETDKVSNFKKNILLIEDDEITAAVIKRSLKQNGFRVIHARESKSALSAASNLTSISLITLDVRIPGIDGFELLRRFRDIPALHEIPIIMLTSAGKPDEVVKGFQLGADDYMVKPFSSKELLARIFRFLQKDGVSAPAA